jgi:hypothetical protein
MCDAARVAREVVRDNDDTPEEVLACIAKGLGFTHISLSRPTVVQSGFPEVIAELPAVLEKLIVILKILMKKYSWLIPLVKNLVDILDKGKSLWDKLVDLPKQILVTEAVHGKCQCKMEVTSTPRLLLRHRFFPGP